MKVLDHGEVVLVDHMGGDLSIARSARVSYSAHWRAGEDEGSDRRLIRYLWRNHHTSPFEAVNLTFYVKAPIFVFRQWHRHRTWSFNEVSARYKQLPSEFYVPGTEQITTQSSDNKQMRTVERNPQADEIQRLIRDSCKWAFAVYEQMLEMGCPRELARGVLPVNTYSEMFGTVSLLNFFRFMSSRLHPHAQDEIRQYAACMLEMAYQVAPEAVTIFIEEGFPAPLDGEAIRSARAQMGFVG